MVVIPGASRLSTRGMPFEPAPAPMGLLELLGHTLDTPRAMAWHTLSGQNPLEVLNPWSRESVSKRISGWDVLGRLGIKDKPGKLDPVDFLAFALEVAGDPLSFFGPGPTKMGRVAKSVQLAKYGARAAKSRLAADTGLSAAQKAHLSQKVLSDEQVLANLTGKYGDIPDLGKTLGERAELGQSGLVNFQLPGMQPVPVIRGAPVMRAFGRVGGALGETRPGQWLLEKFGDRSKVYQSAADKSMKRLSLPEARAISEVEKQLLRVAKNEAADRVRALDKALPAKASHAAFRGFREAYEQPEKLTLAIEDLKLKGLGGEDVADDLTKLEKRRDEVSRLVAENPEFEAGARIAKESTDEALGLEQRAGLEAPELAVEGVSYAERTLTREGIKALRQRGAWGAYKDAVDRVTGRTKLPSQKQRTIREALDENALRKIAERFGVEEFFELDPRLSLTSRLESGARARARLGTIKTLTHHKSAMVIQEVQEALDNAIVQGLEKPQLLEDFAAKEGLTNAGWLADNFAARVDEATKAHLDEVFIPTALAQEIFTLNKVLMKDPKTMGSVRQAWRNLNRRFRFGFTQLFPAYHARNFISNVVMNALAGVWSPDHYREAMKIVYKGIKDPTSATFRRLENLGVISHTFAEELRRDLARASTGKAVTKVGKSAQWIANKAANVGVRVESVGRVAHFLGKKAKGFSDEAAADSVRRYLFNYDELTDFERNVMRDVFFFYTFPRKAAETLATEFFQNSPGMALFTRATAQPSLDRGPMPRWMQERTAVPWGRDPQTGETKTITGFGTPLEEILQRLDISSKKPGFLGGLQRVGEKIAGQTVPQLRAATEVVSGRDFFLNEEIVQADRAYSFLRHVPKELRDLLDFEEYKTPSGATRYRANPEVLYFLRNTPFGRALNVAGKMDDPRREGFVEKWLPQMSGFRTHRFDPKEQAVRQKLDSINQKLREKQLEGKTRNFPIFYATQPLGKQDPETEALLKLLRSTQKELKEVTR